MSLKGKCTHCKSAIDEKGYGRMSFNNKTVYEHRLVYILSHPQEDISKKIIHHICKNKWCINPKHLIAITRKQHSAEHGLSGWAKFHYEKTQCKNGHPLDRRNKNQRYCSICRKISANKYARLNREKQNEWKRKNRWKYREKEREYQKIYRLKIKQKKCLDMG